MFEEYINLSDRSYGINVKPVEHFLWAKGENALAVTDFGIIHPAKGQRF